MPISALGLLIYLKKKVYIKDDIQVEVMGSEIFTVV